MEWEEKYRLEYYDIWDILWIVKLHIWGYSGSITYLQGSGEAIVFEHLNESDDVFDPLKPSRVILSVIGDTNFSLAELYSTEDMQVWVEIYQGEDSVSNLYWNGWVDPKAYEEPYDVTPNVVSICCIDGLSLLENILYAENEEDSGGKEDITYYSGRRLESQCLLDILGKIGFTEFKEFINIYEEEMLDSVNDSPMDQNKPDADVFKGKYCDEVLYALLKKKNACIRQVNGVFCIYRPKEIIETIVYGRYFTGATIKTSVSFIADQFINRVGHNTNLKQVPGGNQMVQAAIRKVTVNLDYGNKESWLKNWEFKAETFVNGEFNEWVLGGASDAKIESISSFSRGDKAGVALAPGADVVGDGPGTLTQFIPGAVVSVNDGFILEFEFGWYNDSGNPIDSGTYLELQIKQGSQYLSEVSPPDEQTCEWINSPAYIMILASDILLGATIPIGQTDWYKWKRAFIGIKGTEDIEFILISSLSVAVGGTLLYNCFKNVKFYTSSFATVSQIQTSTGVIRSIRQSTESTRWNKQRINYELHIIDCLKWQYIKSNFINGEERIIDSILGDIVESQIDNVLGQFLGSLGIYNGSLSGAAANFVTDHAADYNPGGTGNVIVTSSGNDIIMTAETAGHTFVGNTTITNTSGDISGTVTHPQININTVAQVDLITKNGDSGGSPFGITIKGVTKYITWVTSATLTINAWAAGGYGGGFAGINLNNNGDGSFTATAATPGEAFSSAWEESGFGSVSTTTPNNPGQKRIDKITLSGISGTANVLCDGVTEEVEVGVSLIPSVAWHTRDEDSSAAQKPLLKLIGDETAYQYSRPTDLIDMPIQEISGETTLNLIGNIQDDKKQTGGINKKFIVNRGSFYARSRRWRLDLAEIIN